MGSAISDLGSIMGIWAHPDDETFLIGGLLAIATQNGQRVSCVTATRGEAGVQNPEKWPAETLAQTRSTELAAALDVLGVPNHTWLDYPDGGCSGIAQTEAVTRLVALINEYRPDTIITFAPDGLTGHEDHKTVYQWSKSAIKLSEIQPELWCAVHTQEIYDAAFKDIHERHNVYFNIDTPKLIPFDACDIALTLPDEVLDKKIAALRAMPSQFESFFNGISSEEASLAFETEGLVRASKWVQF